MKLTNIQDKLGCNLHMAYAVKELMSDRTLEDEQLQNDCDMMKGQIKYLREECKQLRQALSEAIKRMEESQPPKRCRTEATLKQCRKALKEAA